MYAEYFLCLGIFLSGTDMHACTHMHAYMHACAIHTRLGVFQLEKPWTQTKWNRCISWTYIEHRFEFNVCWDRTSRPCGSLCFLCFCWRGILVMRIFFRCLLLYYMLGLLNKFYTQYPCHLVEQGLWLQAFVPRIQDSQRSCSLWQVAGLWHSNARFTFADLKAVPSTNTA